MIVAAALLLVALLVASYMAAQEDWNGKPHT